MEPETSKEAPRLMFWLQVDPVLQRVITPADPLNKSVHKALVQELNGLMETLGIPGEPVVGDYGSPKSAVRRSFYESRRGKSSVAVFRRGCAVSLLLFKWQRFQDRRHSR